ncbi:MAG: thioesterase [Lachnospiraceae bacterium]|nr:thioesterase [Lachnospiraceae bacterium]
MYEFESRVRYSEIDVNCELKWSALVNYLQDCSTFQSEELGIGVDYLLGRGLAWVVNYWQIDLIRMPKLTDKIIIGTIPYELKGFLGLRNFYIKDAVTGEMLVKVNSVWTLIDLNKVRPVKADENMMDGYVLGDKLDMEYTDRKISFEGDFRTEACIVVDKWMLDPNQHVNNQKYIEMALAYLPDGAKIRRLRIEYSKSCFLGDRLIPAIYEKEGSLGVAFTIEGEAKPAVKCSFDFD